MDAADQVNVVWTAGDYPITELRSMGNPAPAPLAVTAPHFGEPFTSATMTGRARVGRVLTCDAGFVVEANDVNWRWYRQGTGSLMRQGVTTDCGTPMTASASSARWSRKG